MLPELQDCASLPGRSTGPPDQPVTSCFLRDQATIAFYLNLAGDIVSGHPDRHVLQVRLPSGHSAYLKKEHCVHWRDRLESWWAGFGWVAKSIREAQLLARLPSLTISAPRLLACGDDGRGRAFVLIENVADADDLRQKMHNRSVSRELVARLGRWCARLHDQNIHQPDCNAKHFLIHRATGTITLLDWQRASIQKTVTWRQRVRALALLVATLPRIDQHDLAYSDVLELLLLNYRQASSDRMLDARSFKAAILKRVGKLWRRSNIRDQWPSIQSLDQKLVWLAGEGFCVRPAWAGHFQTSAEQEGIYRSSGQASSIALAGARMQVRTGRYYRQLSLLMAWMRGTNWRSPELVLARLHFHLERYSIPLAELIAFGQRVRGWRLESFVLWRPLEPAQPLASGLREANDFRRVFLLQQLSELVARLHAARCTVGSLEPFLIRESKTGPSLALGDVTMIRHHRHLSERRKSADVRKLIRTIIPLCAPTDIQRFIHWVEENKSL